MKKILLVRFVVVWIYGGMAMTIDGGAGFGSDVARMMVLFL